MVRELYSIGGFAFYSAKELAEFKINYPNDWDSIKSKPLKKSGLSLDEYQDFVDYIDSLEKMPDICLAYRADNARNYGYYTTVWVNGLEIRGIFGYLDSDNLKEHLLFEIVAMSKWHATKVRQNLCR